jgi:hypothetical protein
VVVARLNLVTGPSRAALAILGLTIPVLAFLGQLSRSGGIRRLMSDTLGSRVFGDGITLSVACRPSPRRGARNSSSLTCGTTSVNQGQFDLTSLKAAALLFMLLPRNSRKNRFFLNNRPVIIVPNR